MEAPGFDPSSLISSEKDTEQMWALCTPLSSPSCSAVMEDTKSPEIFQSEYAFQSPLHYAIENFGENPDSKLECKKKYKSPKYDGDDVASVDTDKTFSADSCFKDGSEKCQPEYKITEIPYNYTNKDLNAESNEGNLILNKNNGGNKDVETDFFKEFCAQKPEAIALSSHLHSTHSEAHQESVDYNYGYFQGGFFPADEPVPSDCSYSEISGSIGESQSRDIAYPAVNTYFSSVAFEFQRTNAQNMVNSEVQSDEGIVWVENVTNIGTGTDSEIITDNSETTQESETESQIANGQNINNALESISENYGNITDPEIYDSEITNQSNIINLEMEDDDCEGYASTGNINNIETPSEIVNEQDIINLELQENTCIDKVPVNTASEIMNETFTNKKDPAISEYGIINGQTIINTEVQDNNYEKNTRIDDISSTGIGTDSETISKTFETIKDFSNSEYETINKDTITKWEMQNYNEKNILSANMTIAHENINNCKTVKHQANEKSGTPDKQNIVSFEMEVQNPNMAGNRCIENITCADIGKEFKIANKKSETVEDSVISQSKVINEENDMESKAQDNSEGDTENIHSNGNFLENSRTINENLCLDSAQLSEQGNQSISSKETIINMDKNNEKGHPPEIQPIQNMDTDGEFQITESKNNNCLSCCINCKKPYFDSTADELESKIMRAYTVRPVINLTPLIDLFSIDNNLSKTILSALSSEFKENGVTQTEILHYLREKKFSGTITELKQGIQTFFTAAEGVNIIYKKNKRRFLNLMPVKEEQLQMEESKPACTQKRIRENHLESEKDLSKRARSQKSAISTLSNANAEDKSKLVKNENIRKDKQIKDCQLTEKQDLRGDKRTNKVKSISVEDNSRKKQLPLQTKSGKSETETVKGPCRKRIITEVTGAPAKKRKCK